MPLFQFDVDVFEKAEDGEDKARRIGGFVSTERLDRQQETVLQKGLDFGEFLEYGWLNDNHKRDTFDVLGFPTKAEFKLNKGWYIEGYLLKGYPPADAVWTLAKALQKTKRRLGFSIEGKNTLRKSGKVIKSMVTNAAITHVPVNPDCTLEVLTKSFCIHCDTAECIRCDKNCLDKALMAGYGTSPATQTGGGALRVQSIEGQLKDLGYAGPINGGVIKDVSFYVNKGYSVEFSARLVKALRTGVVRV